MIILIPAYKPDTSLVHLAHALKAQHTGSDPLTLLIINDGSGDEYAPIFDELQALGAEVEHHPVNLGKGAALRTGLNWARLYRPEEIVITADADGQHLPKDIYTVAEHTLQAAKQQRKALVLGVRTIPDPAAGLEGTKVPLRSKVGNSMTVGFFALATGTKIADTQTGLRGFTPQIIDWALEIPGNKYQYEFSMLLRATRAGVDLDEVPITKVYEPGNPTSHFRPLQDSALIYAPLLGFLASSFLAGFMVDALALFALVAAGVPLLGAVVAARCISALCNFMVNRLIMQDGAQRPSIQRSMVRYAVLAVALLIANAALLELLVSLGIHLVLAKILTELVLIPISFAVQRRWVFLPVQKTQTAILSARQQTLIYH
ncbi:MAG: glycosyltransferase family 2 protein [Rothia sp. (in: high G+C Gram-positive bacteria)]|uniref:glycosyltransferase n=1 Tax=Rothia sp. (in: high G+C Gram-positive bacteria) TaxID=1885016 RepID=UPI0026E04213|nr:glycosyltransferase family 2 protein [Rothia sp. (in: high G+C Gram-positive bacteria)]MDO5749850.1 glycosyltransferase family 2 protein [Rothia sp. (in: high G+C Gram-positive bacteria)]